MFASRVFVRVVPAIVLALGHFRPLMAATKSRTDWSEDVAQICKRMVKEESLGCIRKLTCGNFGCLPPGWEITWICDEDTYLRLRTCIRVAQRLKSNGFFYCINQWSRQSLSCAEKPIRANHKTLTRDAYYCGPITVVVDAAGNTEEIDEFYVSQSYNGRMVYVLRESDEQQGKVKVLHIVGEWKNAVYHALSGETTDELAVSNLSYGTYCHRPDPAS